MSDVELLHFSEENLHTGEGARVLHQCGVPATYKIHTHDFYELFLVSHGGAIHAVNGRSQLLSEGSFVLMRPRDVHRYDFFNNADFGCSISVFRARCLSACVIICSLTAPYLIRRSFRYIVCFPATP